ncbi:hypothetical protein N7516_003033 [Penicillium verrucosum]|uniref:uncharacterized protein n=1 Tax=Penicillium verrucosum TaxID=60171 RepID=UPI0025456A52|nr:uncharacterized protein N7516_003033 [Penicillium verrucosum]KAJ5942865.1 hypothetical protein N7516_003033 [Penicillium verrucosum]
MPKFCQGANSCRVVDLLTTCLFRDIFSQSSIKETTDKLESFDQARIRKLNAKPCCCKCSPRRGCSIPWDEVVSEFRKGTLEYFDGLCLDCMKHSPRKSSKYGNVQVTKMVMTKIVVLRAVNMVAEWDGWILRYFGVQP